MTTSADQTGYWDDELEELSSRAAAILGEDAVAITVEQLFARLRHDRDSSSFAQFGTALKAELQCLVRPH